MLSVPYIYVQKCILIVSPKHEPETLPSASQTVYRTSLPAKLWVTWLFITDLLVNHKILSSSEITFFIQLFIKMAGICTTHSGASGLARVNDE